MSRVRNHGTENGVRNASLWRALLGVENTVIEAIEFSEVEDIVIALSLARRAESAAPAGAAT